MGVLSWRRQHRQQVVTTVYFQFLINTKPRIIKTEAMNSSSASALSLSYREDNTEKFSEAFNAFDWNKSGKISYSSLQAVMRRCGHNPTDVEVADIINKVHDDTDSLGFEAFCNIMEDRIIDADPETSYKECF